MNRRTVLRRTGALGALALAGCVSKAADDASPDQSESPTDTVDSGATGGSGDGKSVSEASVETVSSDCAANEVPAATVSFYDAASAVEFAGALRTPTPCHEVTLRAAGYDAERDALAVVLGTAATREGCVDCVGVVEFEGRVAFSGGLPGRVYVANDEAMLAMASSDRPEPSPSPTPTPGEPTVGETSFTVTGAESGTMTSEATVRFDAEAGRVVVGGTIPGSDSCKTAQLGSVEYDAGADRLSVGVETTRREGTEDAVCTQAIVEIDYEAEVAFSGGLPGTVVVTHDGREVASGSHRTASADDGT
jgi:hypothetical protein